MYICTQLETYAIYEAVKIGHTSNSDTIIIISDSFSAITSILNAYPENELVHLIQRMLSTTNKIISFTWIPSHVGIPGNEKVDSKANEATIPRSSTKITKIKTSDAMNNIKNKLMDTWQNDWSNVPLSNKLRNIKPYVKKRKISLDITRREEVNYPCENRTYSFNSFNSYLISKKPKPSCETFRINLSIRHNILIDCPKFSEARGILNNPSTKPSTETTPKPFVLFSVKLIYIYKNCNTLRHNVYIFKLYLS